jgi:hypothetical protein
VAYQFLKAAQYIDEVLALLLAIEAYNVSRNEALLVNETTQIALDLVRQHVGVDPSPLVDEDKLRQGVVLIVEALESVFGGEP